jgi:mannose-6-phosphate isomerase-like protein (cupin superfamily)
MARVGETIENAVTGERITWRRVDAAALEWEDVWPRPGHRAAPHVHPGMEERWQVTAGQAAFRIGADGPGSERVLGVGESIVAPAGVTHSGWNPTDGEVRLLVTMTPALRWAAVVEKLFGWAADGRTDAMGTPEPELLVALLAGYAAEIAPPR